MDEGTFNCSSLLACLNVFHVLWDTEEGKEEQQGGITISSCFLLIPLTKQDSVAIIPYYITWKQRMLSNFGLKCLFTYFVFQAPKYCEFLWSKDRAQHWLWFTEDPMILASPRTPLPPQQKASPREWGKDTVRYKSIWFLLLQTPTLLSLLQPQFFPVHKTCSLTCAWLTPVVYIIGKLTAHNIDSLSLSNIQERFINA